MSEKKIRRHPGGGKPPKPLSEFGQVRPNTARFEILKYMSINGGEHVEKIADEVGITPIAVLQAAYCLWRDIGIGYRLSPNSNLCALYPSSKGFSDAVRAPKPTKVVKRRQLNDA